MSVDDTIMRFLQPRPRFFHHHHHHHHLVINTALFITTAVILVRSFLDERPFRYVALINYYYYYYYYYYNYYYYYYYYYYYHNKNNMTGNHYGVRGNEDTATPRAAATPKEQSY